MDWDDALERLTYTYKGKHRSLGCFQIEKKAAGAFDRAARMHRRDIWDLTYPKTDAEVAAKANGMNKGTQKRKRSASGKSGREGSVHR